MSHLEEARLHAYLDGALSGDARAEVERHLAGCERCRSDLEEARRLLGRSREILGRVEPEHAREVPWSEIEARGSARRSKKPRIPSWGLAWAASLALAFAAGWLTQTRVEPPAFTRARELAEEEPLALSERAAEATGLRTEAETPPPESRNQAQARARSAPAEGAAQAAAPEPTAKAEEKPPQTAQRPPALAAPDDTTPVGVEELVVVAEAERAAAAPEPPAAGAAFERRAYEAAARRAREDALARSVEGDPFIPTTVDEAQTWLGAPLRTLPELELRRVEVGPGAAVPDGVAGLPAIRLVYMDAAAHEIVLMQQVAAAPAQDESPALIVEPTGMRMYRWRDDRGYHLILRGPLGGDSLRALAERVR